MQSFDWTISKTAYIPQSNNKYNIEYKFEGSFYFETQASFSTFY